MTSSWSANRKLSWKRADRGTEQHCRRRGNSLIAALDKLDLENSQSGFPWYRMSKLEHQLVNLRHIQHHAAQLADRLRSAAMSGSSGFKVALALNGSEGTLSHVPRFLPNSPTADREPGSARFLVTMRDKAGVIIPEKYARWRRSCGACGIRW
jgi:hypothetical protein